MKTQRPLESDIVAECNRYWRVLLERYAWAILRDWSLAADTVQVAYDNGWPTLQTEPNRRQKRIDASFRNSFHSAAHPHRPQLWCSNRENEVVNQIFIQRRYPAQPSGGKINFPWWKPYATPMSDVQ